MRRAFATNCKQFAANFTRPRKESVVTRTKLHVVLLTVLTATASAVTLAVADNPRDDPQGPNVAVDEAQWPNIPSDKLPEPRINPRPSFLDADQVTNRILGLGGIGNTPDVTGSTPRWPELPPEKRPSDYSFEVGARYW